MTEGVLPGSAIEGSRATRLGSRVALLFLFGATVLTTMDGFHTHSGATSYPDPVVVKMAWWVPLLFGSTAALGGVSFVLLHRALRAPARALSSTDIAVGLAAFGGLYFASGYLPASNAVIAGLLLAGALALWRWLDRTWQGVVLGIGTAFAGCSTEIFLTSIGAFSHLRADFLGIPVWLPALYLASTPAVGHFARKVLEPALVPAPG